MRWAYPRARIYRLDLCPSELRANVLCFCILPPTNPGTIHINTLSLSELGPRVFIKGTHVYNEPQLPELFAPH